MMKKGDIIIKDVSDKYKRFNFWVDGLSNGFTVGLTYPDLPLDDPKQGISIAYKGEVVIVPFNRESRAIVWALGSF